LPFGMLGERSEVSGHHFKRMSQVTCKADNNKEFDEKDAFKEGAFKEGAFKEGLLLRVSRSYHKAKQANLH